MVFPTSPGPLFHREGAVAALLLCVTLAVHGAGVTFGFFLDDNNHLELCQKYGYAGLAQGNRFDWTHGIVRVWWAEEEAGWAYFRPIPVALRVTWLRLFGLNPLPSHIIHLTLYCTLVLLFYGLLRRCGCAMGPAFMGGLLFTLHPTHAQVTPWLGCDMLVLAGLAFVLALWMMRASLDAGHRRPILVTGIFACYAVAMLSRETGLMLGPILILFDRLSVRAAPLAAGLEDSPRGVAAQRIPWLLYGGLAAEGVLYLGLRWLCLDAAPLPRSPYFHWPTEAGFAEWLPYKLLSDLVCLPLGLPFMPIIEAPWLRARPVSTAIAAFLVVAIFAFFIVPQRRTQAVWGILAGMALVAAPTVLAFSAPYQYFLLSAGWAALLALWTRQWWPQRPRLVAGILATLAVLYAAGTWVSAWQFQAAAYAERCVREEVLETKPADYPPGTKLFFLDLPLFASEIGPALRLQTGRNDLEVFPLTYAPGPFALLGDSEIIEEDSYTVLVRRQDDGWFPGILGEDLQLGWFGASRQRLPPGPVPRRPAAGPLPFRVEVVETGPDGIRALRFVFEKPLDDPAYRFFAGNPWSAAQPWKAHGLWTGPRIDVQLSRRYGRMRRTQMGVEWVADALARLP